MKKIFGTFLTLVLLMLGTGMAWADFKDFSVILNNQAGTLLTSEEQVQGTAFEFGIVVGSDGTVTRVAKDDATSVATVSGKYHSEHGSNNVKVVVPVDGGVKVTIGTCSFGTSTVKATDSNGTAYEFASQKGDGSTTCWKNNKANVISGHYTGGATTLTIEAKDYVPYISVEAANASSSKVTYAKGNVECEGDLLPAAVEVIAGENTKIPANYTLYKEGYTLTGWSDGTNTYAIGSNMTPTADVTLTPVFTKNEKNLADRTEAVTVNWNFRRDQGAPTIAYEGKPGIYVTQAVVNGKTIDVKVSFTTSPGKLNNSNNNDWVQVNTGTTFTIPSCKGAVVSMEAYDNITTTTIDGQKDYNPGKTISYTVANASETVDVVIGDGSYYRYIQVVLPVVQAAGGKTYTNEPANVTWNFNDANTYATANSVTPADAFSLTTFNLNGASVVGTGTSVHASGVTFVSIKPATGADDVIEWSVKPKSGLTFTPTKVSGYITRNGTDKENGITITGKAGSESIKLGNYTAARNNKSGADDKFSGKTNYASKFEITLTSEQQTKLSGTDGFTLSSTIGVGVGNPSAGFSNIVIEGIINGTMEDVATYTLNVAANPEAGGSVSKYPNAEIYEENSEVTLTAEENFGYDFVNWTNAAGEEVSKDAKFKAIVTAAETYTANFVKVNTYALDVTVDGGNDYMVTLNPAPTVVEGKKMYEAGTKVTLTASSNPIITFTNWSDGQTEKEIVYTMDADKSVTANFSAIDFIVGWDFMLAGNNSRKADFFAADNDAVTLDMRKEDGSIVGWLDKSQLGAGGYEGRPGGVCWVTGTENGDIGHCYWQTKVNAEAFTNIKIITAMVYNYNAYQTYNVEVSIDGISWEKAGSVVMTGTKNWTDATIELAAKYSNVKELYIRWIADKTSNIDGSASKNDGACIGATYIIGTAKLIDDGTAPKLVSSVPAEGADNASANGKIVLTFDEKVKVAENAVATLNGKELTPSVSGKAVTFEYKGLEYSSSYTFTLPANSVADLTDNFIDKAITINFKTKTKPEIERGEYDIVIDDTDEYFNPLTDEQKGKLLAEAIETANKRADQTKRFRIFLFPGVYKIPASSSDLTVTQEVGANKIKTPFTYKDPRTFISGNNISIIGLDYENTTITNTTPKETFANAFGQNANISEGIGNNDVFQITGKNIYFQGVTIKTGIGDNAGRDIAVHDKGDKNIYKNTRLWGYQDTYTNNNTNGRFYFENGIVRGRTDYLCGKGDIWFESVTLQQIKGGYAAVPSTPKKYGWIFNNCTIKGETSDVDGNYTLGRPWGSGTPIALFINTKMEAKPSAIGWNEMSGGWPARFAEYNSVTASGTTISLSNRKKIFADTHENDPILTAVEASEYSIAKVLGDGDDWDPTAATEQASAPTNATISKDATVSWDDSKYVYGWMLFYQMEDNSDIVPFGYVTVNHLNLRDDDNETAKAKAFSATNDDIEIKHMYVAAINEMGGIGELTEIVVADPTSIKNNIQNNLSKSSAIYNIAGQKISKDYKGIIINNGKKMTLK